MNPKMSFLDKLKSVFKSKGPPPYKNYTHSQLKVIAMKARIQLEQHYKKCIQIIRAQDSILFQRKKSSSDRYRILQQIGKHVIEVQCIKVYVELLRKIEDKCAAIVKTNGDIALLKMEINWFQCLLWYRKCKKVISLEDFNAFCYNFFKGVDVTCEINPKCQIFKIYPLMLYLNPDCIIPLKKIYPQITTYITTTLDFNQLDETFRVNKTDIKKWVSRDQISYHERFLSKSADKIGKQKQKSPKKTSQHKGTQSQGQESSISIKPFPSVPGKSKMESETGTNKNESKESNDPNKGGSSFFKKVIDSSKLRQKKAGYICAECGIQVQLPPQSVSTGSENQVKQQQAPNFAKLCKTCQTVKLIQQQEKKKKNQNQNSQGKIPESLCKTCNKPLPLSNEISFSSQNTKVKNPASISFGEQIHEQQRSKGKNPTSVSFGQEMCQQCFQKQQREMHGNKNGQILIDDFNNKDISSGRPQNQQKSISQKKGALSEKEINGSPEKGQTAREEREEREVDDEWHEDEAESVRFIKQSFAQKKKPIKKPYMVSIYARAEYMNMNQLHKK